MSIPDNAPVLVGVGAIQQKETDITISKEPIALMIDAVNAALQDSQAPQLAADIECITVPKGMWSYSNPAALIADAIGAGKAKTVQGSEIKITLKNGSVYVNGAKVVTADVKCSNGVIHIIDSVIMPPKK